MQKDAPESPTEFVTPDDLTKIEENTFGNYNELRKIYISRNIRNIDAKAFIHCNNLDSIIVDSRNKYYISRGNCLIEKSTNTLVVGSKNSIIPKGVTTIEECVFNGCENLSSVSIPKSVTAIGDFAFEDCEKLLSIEIPNNVTTIGNRAFYGCGRLTSITIPGRVTNIGDRAFSKCYSLTSIKVINNKHYDSRNNCNAIIETNSNALIVGCLKTIIPSSVSTISKRAFDGYSHLTSITIPEGVQYIEDDAFYDCYLSTVFLSNSIISIGNDAFSLNTCPDYRFRIIIPNGTNEKYEKLLPKYKDNILEKEVYLFKLKTKVTDDDFI